MTVCNDRTVSQWSIDQYKREFWYRLYDCVCVCVCVSILGFLSGAVVSIFLGYGAAWLGDWRVTFRHNVMVSFWRIEMSDTEWLDVFTF